MAKTKANDLRDLSAEQLQAKIAEAREEAFRLRFRSATETIDNPTQFRTLRRNVARMETILRQKTAGR